MLNIPDNANILMAYGFGLLRALFKGHIRAVSREQAWGLLSLRNKKMGVTRLFCGFFGFEASRRTDVKWPGITLYNSDLHQLWEHSFSKHKDPRTGRILQWTRSRAP